MKNFKIQLFSFLALSILLLSTQIAFSQSRSFNNDTAKEEAVLPDSGIVKSPIHSTNNSLDTLLKETKSDFSEKKKENELPSVSKIFSVRKVIWAFFVLLISYFIIRFLVAFIDGIAERSTKYRITLKSISPILRILGWTLAIFIVIRGIFNPPASAVAAFIASAGIAIGFASQDILKNIFGGIMILFDRPFSMGDKIQVGDYYGEVVGIGLRSTRIVTKDDSLVSIPNAEVVNTAVSNSNSGEPNCQVVAEIYLPLDIDTVKARAIAVQAAQVSKYIYLNKAITVVYINEMINRKSVLKMRLKAYVSDIRYEFVFQSEMTEIVIKELLKAGLIERDI